MMAMMVLLLPMLLQRLLLVLRHVYDG